MRTKRLKAEDEIRARHRPLMRTFVLRTGDGDELRVPAAETEHAVSGTHLCGCCGKKMTGRRPQARYCSDVCRTRANRRDHERRIAGFLDAIAQAVEGLRRELTLQAEPTDRKSAEESTRHG